MTNSGPLIPIGNHVTVDPSKVIATRVREGVPQVKVDPDGAWLDATAYTGSPGRLIAALNNARAVAQAGAAR